MTRQANILSFGEAQKASRSRRAQSSYSRRSTARSGNSSQRVERSFASRYSDGPLRMPSSRSRRVADDDAREPRRPRNERIERAESASRSRQGVRSKREQRQRDRAKSRAERMFAKQFEDAQSSPPADDQAPRAALYEAKMGASHRKSTRMQRASSASPSTAKINPQGWFANVRVPKWALRLGTAVLCLVLAGVFLYTPAQHYYQAQRERDRLAAEYQIIQERNDALDSQNKMLSSNAGMEDAARAKYGYVVQGDQVAVVAGLSDETANGSKVDGVEANVLSSAVKAPEQWYTPYLDALFGVS